MITMTFTEAEFAALRSLTHREAVAMRRASERPLNRKSARIQAQSAAANALWAKIDEAADQIAA